MKESGLLGEKELQYYERVSSEMDETTAVLAIYRMADFLSRYYGKKTIILLDEYDTPMQDAYVNGFWDEAVSYTRSMFNAAFKTNPYLERAIMTGITRTSRESIFSELNHLEVVTTTSNKYTDVFGFTEAEVFAAMDEMGYTEREEVRKWYDGFTFGTKTDIYHPWSILNFLDTGRFDTYWTNTSSNSLADKLIREGSRTVKQNFERLLNGESITAEIDEQIVYHQLKGNQNVIWSLFLAAGYLKVVSYDETAMRCGRGKARYELKLTNTEVRLMFGSMISGWFLDYAEDDYTDFIRALLKDDRRLMNICMNRVLLATISYFDGGNRPSGSEPERFYHGLVLGLMVELYDRYVVTSNRESGFGRYDIMLEPRNQRDPAMIMEFRVHDPEEKTLEDTAAAALRQIEEKCYVQTLTERGIAVENIRTYGFAFEGKHVLIR